MNQAKVRFSKQYTALLGEYANSLEEAPLAAIEALGQQMVQLGMPPEEIGEMHDCAIAELITSSAIDPDKIRSASLPLMQLLMSYGVAFRAMLATKKAEEQLHLASRAIENAADGIMIADADGFIISVNHAFERTTGYTRDEAIGNTPAILHSGKQDRAFYQQMWATIHQKGEWQGKIYNRRKSGEIYPEHLSVTAIHNNDGAVSHYVGVFSDISEQLSLEQQLNQAQKMEAVGTLVGGIAHDFNNMLAGITGNMYLAKRRLQKGERISEAIDKITAVEDLCQQAASMISQLLIFARKGIVEMHALSMSSFVKESLKLARVSIPENIRVRHDISTEPVWVNGDITQLQQVLLNLLNNARDAVEDAPDPQIELKLASFIPDDAFIEQHPESEGNSFAWLSISDNGCGIAREHLDQVFDPFFTTKLVGKGTGLGLSMVYGAVQSHGGFIDVESKQGRGTTFHIYLPLIEQPGEQQNIITAMESMEAQGEIILLADDEFNLRETTAEVLESLGYRVYQAKDGLEALDVFSMHQDEIALAILDVVMPNCGGIELANQIRAINPYLPILFLTGYDKEHVLGGSEQMQHSQILSKPVRFDVLSHTLRNMLD